MKHGGKAAKRNECNNNNQRGKKKLLSSKITLKEKDKKVIVQICYFRRCEYGG